MDILESLFALRDKDYKAFNAKLIPNVNPDLVIGVRTPQLRAFAKQICKTEEAEIFLNTLPHTYFEENNLHGFLIEAIRDYDECIDRLERFLPYIDNWATCDQTNPKALKKNLPQLLQEIQKWLRSDQTYTVRFAIGMLMRYFCDAEHFELVAQIRSEEYYVKMMAAWFFATALAKNYDAALPYLNEKRLDPWVHNKTIRKAVESYRITPQQKEYLKQLKV